MRILVVEDQPLIALTLADVLAVAGHHVIGPAYSSAEAWTLATTQAPTIAFVDVDLEAPGAGLELTRRLHQELGVCVFLTTGRPEIARTSDWALGLLAKPYNPQLAAQSVGIVDAILRHGEFTRPQPPRGVELFTRNIARIRTRELKQRPILLVEDHMSDAKLALAALEGAVASTDIIVARDGVEAIEYLEACTLGRRLPTLTLLDIKMPRVDGLELLERMKTTPDWKSIPVVMLSDSREVHDVRRAYSLGANAFVYKPRDCDGFTQTLARVSRFWLRHNRMSPHAFAS